MTDQRTFTIVDGAAGPIIYRLTVETIDALADQLRGLAVTAECARNTAKAAWGGCVVGFDSVALVVVPGDHPAIFADYSEGA